MTASFHREVIGDATLYLGDCLDVLPTLDKTQAIITDPPYGKVKGDFDHVWTRREHLLDDAARWRDAFYDALTFNGTLWMFAGPALAGRLEALLAERFNPLAHVVWEKPTPLGQKCCKEDLRSPHPLSERILMFEHHGADNTALGESGYRAKCDEVRGFVFEPLRAYLDGEWKRAGLTNKDANEATGTQMAGHYFTQTQWALPTRENYEKLRARANACGGDYLRREYEDLRREYEDLRRWFDCRSGDQFSDVWRFAAPTSNHGHPTEKPIPLMEYLVRLSVRPGAVCVDPFMGSGTTGVACANLGRPFVGIERDPRYFEIACERVEMAQAQQRLFA